VRYLHAKNLNTCILQQDITIPKHATKYNFKISKICKRFIWIIDSLVVTLVIPSLYIRRKWTGDISFSCVSLRIIFYIIIKHRRPGQYRQVPSNNHCMLSTQIMGRYRYKYGNVYRSWLCLLIL